MACSSALITPICATLLQVNEITLVGLISLLLIVLQDPISKICSKLPICRDCPWCWSILEPVLL